MPKIKAFEPFKGEFKFQKIFLRFQPNQVMSRWLKGELFHLYPVKETTASGRIVTCYRWHTAHDEPLGRSYPTPAVADCNFGDWDEIAVLTGYTPVLDDKPLSLSEILRNGNESTT